MGAFVSFATNATGFDKKFPGINGHLLTLSRFSFRHFSHLFSNTPLSLFSNFKIPFYGLYLAIFGVCDASKESINHILSSGPGESVVLVIGGHLLPVFVKGRGWWRGWRGLVYAGVRLSWCGMRAKLCWVTVGTIETDPGHFDLT